ncbi:low-density lipoprotein receptor-related protein 11 isoform X2 [Artibeus jamaicensis]|uniref:low-density lipoprotein receptor-related protein 11 isoform X2 n=1 Tax=Artibeus jamaicensis TaxID=9417 RepID=UPI00235B2061|nr:low-density lipoprotein receptor-related protein 11 isoform X2 [Artibeus jamaicensis]
MAFTSQESAGPERRRPPRHPALLGLLLLCLWLSSGRAAGPPPAQLSELQAQLSGVEQLLEDFRRQLQQERPQEELELRASRGPQQSCPSRGSGSYSVMSDAIIRIKDSIAAGASFLRAPAAVRDWRQCVAACCSEPRCSVAVVELPRRPAPLAPALGCYLFNCTASGRSVCRFALRRGYSSYSLSRALEGQQDLETGVTARASPGLGKDAPPLSKAGQDVVLRLPTDEVTLDGRQSTDDHAIVRYEWALLQGDPSVDMKVPQSGTLKLSHLQEGTYTFQLTVTDAAAQRSSDNVSVTVLPAASSPGGCSKVCSRYHFFCDDGCCIDITLACDGVEQCPDRSDEAFCRNLSLERKATTHTATAQPRSTGRSEDAEHAAGGFSSEKFQEAAAPNGPPALSDVEKRNRSTFWGPKIPTDPVVPDSGSSKSRKEENYIFESKSNRGGAEHPAPEMAGVTSSIEESNPSKSFTRVGINFSQIPVM